MSNNNFKDRYINLIKQTSAIELSFVATEEGNQPTNVLHKVNEEESISLNSENRTSLQRAQRRIQLQQAREQQNLEQIFALTATYLNQNINLDRLELDWIMRFNELAKQVYSPHLQEIWAKIFAIELGSPNSFSYRAIKTLSELSLKEARIFQKAANLLCRIGDDKSDKLITAIYQKPSVLAIFTQPTRIPLNLTALGLGYSQVVTLIELGLVQGQEIETTPYQSSEKIALSYLGDKFSVEVKSKELVITYYRLTPVGQELVKLVTTARNVGFYKQLKGDFQNALSFVGAGQFEV